ncbi:hypothetical protein NEOKW01_0529 [Nematocida sp. AWRm80]|nr:hypothetical protein NEOKW01_0529 [Nematocida sp. AWRm80]
MNPLVIKQDNAQELALVKESNITPSLKEVIYDVILNIYKEEDPCPYPKYISDTLILALYEKQLEKYFTFNKEPNNLDLSKWYIENSDVILQTVYNGIYTYLRENKQEIPAVLALGEQERDIAIEKLSINLADKIVSTINTILNRYVSLYNQDVSNKHVGNGIVEIHNIIGKIARIEIPLYSDLLNSKLSNIVSVKNTGILQENESYHSWITSILGMFLPNPDKLDKLFKAQEENIVFDIDQYIDRYDKALERKNSSRKSKDDIVVPRENTFFLLAILKQVIVIEQMRIPPQKTTPSIDSGYALWLEFLNSSTDKKRLQYLTSLYIQYKNNLTHEIETTYSDIISQHRGYEYVIRAREQNKKAILNSMRNDYEAYVSDQMAKEIYQKKKSRILKATMVIIIFVFLSVATIAQFSSEPGQANGLFRLPWHS